MAGRSNPKRDKVLEAARKTAKSAKTAIIDPLLLYGRAMRMISRPITRICGGRSAHAAAEISAGTARAHA